MILKNILAGIIMSLPLVVTFCLVAKCESIKDVVIVFSIAAGIIGFVALCSLAAVQILK